MLKPQERELIKKRDFKLVKEILAGNKDSFAKLMTFYKVRILNFGKSFFHNDSDSEDFVQDVFIKVFTHLDSFKGNSMFSTWLMKIAYTTAINSVKRAKTWIPIEDETIIPDSLNTSPEEIQIRKLTKDAIREAISELPEKYKVCVEMYFCYDISYQEISEITDFPLNTIKSHIFRAKKILKDKLEGFYER